jgi:hypothetical protein
LLSAGCSFFGGRSATCPDYDRELRHNGPPAPHCHPDRSGRLFPPLANASAGRVVEGSASPRAAGNVFPEYPWLNGCSGVIEEGGRAFSTSSGQLENRNGCGLYLQPANIKVWALPGVGSTWSPQKEKGQEKDLTLRLRRRIGHAPESAPSVPVSKTPTLENRGSSTIALLRKVYFKLKVVQPAKTEGPA